jgi:hypothetical protein
MDIVLPILGLLMIMAIIVGATIRINTLMKGKIINVLLNKKLLLLLSISLTFIGSVNANSNSIEGAFGYKLGEVVKGIKISPLNQPIILWLTFFLS